MVGPITIDPIDRFENLYEENPETACWEWTACKNEDGYGLFFNGETIVRAHVWGYEYHRDEVPREMELDHLCRSRSCVNPRHLEIVTHKENMFRARDKSRRSHCKKGHEFSPENVYVYNIKGRIDRIDRRCRTCMKEYQRDYYFKVTKKKTEETKCRVA